MMSTMNLSLEQWTQAFEELTDAMNIRADMALVANPDEELSDGAQELVNSAMKEVLEAEEVPKALVVSAESFSFDGLIKFLKEGIQRLYEFVKRIFTGILDFIRGVDAALADNVPRAMERCEKVAEKVDKVAEKVKDPVQWPSAALMYGDRQITSVRDLNSSMRNYLKSRNHIFLLLERERVTASGLINLVLALQTGDLDESNASTETLVKDRKKEDSRISFQNLEYLLNGVKITDNVQNITIDENASDILKTVGGLTFSKPHFFECEPATLGKPGSKEILELMGNLDEFNFSKHAIGRNDLYKRISDTANDLTNLLGWLQKKLRNAKEDPTVSDKVTILIAQKVMATLFRAVSTHAEIVTTISRIDLGTVRKVQSYLVALDEFTQKNKTTATA